MKRGLGYMTVQRDTLQLQKDALTAELITTRQARDGYFAVQKSPWLSFPRVFATLMGWPSAGSYRTGMR